MTRGEKAEALFLEGYNCPQSVVLAFADKLPMDAETAARLVSAFGGGMSRMREVCGAASGMLFVLGALEGYANPADTDGKTALYTHGQALIRAFAETNGKGSFICAEILGKPRVPEPPVPEARTESYYKARPCGKIVRAAADALGRYLGET